MTNLIKHEVRSTYGPDGAVILDIDLGLMVSVNVVGAKIWKKLECHQPVSAIIDDLCAEFGMSRQAVALDVTDFLCNLSRHSLIDWDDPGALQQGEIDEPSSNVRAS
jgi:hypothetical protein